MAKVRTAYVCSRCGGVSPRWSGQCPQCREWNTLVEEVLRQATPRSGARSRTGRPNAAPAPILLEGVPAEAAGRWPVGLGDLDLALGGGLVPGSVVLVGGEPGIGKSTLLLQLAARFVGAGRSVLYVSGEESAAQVRIRAGRLREPAMRVPFLAETDLEAILAWLEAEPVDLLVLDSVQTVYLPPLESTPGSVLQVREVATAVGEHAKSRGAAVFLVGHVTKEGGLAGPKTLEHLVDVVLYFEGSGSLDHRVVRATKNRFGPVDEIAVFRMTPEGLDPVLNPSALFLSGRRPGVSGSAVFVALPGTRPVMVEVQALTPRTLRGRAPRSPAGPPQRVASGFDARRLALLLAVLDRRAGITAGAGDVFVNVVGGLQIEETAADAAAAAAVVSAARDVPVDPQAVCFGEIGLGGELRAVAGMDRRLAEAARMGFQRAVVPEGDAGPDGIEVVRASDVAGLLHALFG